MIFGYPVSEQQLEVLYLFGINGFVSLWILRLLSLILMIFVLKMWKSIFYKFKFSNIGWYSSIVLAISPLIFVLILVYPLVCVKLLIVAVFFQKSLKNKYYLVVLGLILILFNINILGNNPAIFNKLDLQDAQNEVTKRISAEDSVLNSIYLPLAIRRASYNKLFISYKQILGEILPFFDFETIFFQEINPLMQKSVVMFYWPEVYLFVLGIFALFKLKNNKLFNFLGGSIFIAVIDYVFSEGSSYLRLVLVVFPLSIIIAFGLNHLVEMTRKYHVISIVALTGVSLFILMGVGTSFYDLNVRPDYWLDNRPIAFEFWFKEISRLNIDQYNSVYVSSLVGDSKKYCYFYLGVKCNDKRFVFKSFDLSKERVLNAVYAGFAGEFVGAKLKNDIDVDWETNSIAKIVNKISLRDTIANQYGNDIGVGIYQ